ncbi:MAG TPA: HAD family hydrolase [Blastocatellia bacterium]|nr:HAD family hydrolase [Blastocatellia bacterium]
MRADNDLRRAVFIDRDGTINEDIGYVSSPEELIVYPFAAQAVRLVNQSEMKVIVITNQSGVARSLYTEQMLAAIHDRLTCELALAHARIDGIYYCPHHPEIGDETYRKACECRKPRPGLLLEAARDHQIDLAASYVIGDKASDINLAAEVGATGVLVLTGYGRQTLLGRGRPCSPAVVADDLLEAVRVILDRERVEDVRC